jgi:DNA-directed RNA polymerase specialized sigma24 family protein
MLGNEVQAREVVQDTMVTIWQKLKNIKTAAVYKTWIYRIVVNKCYDEMRKRKRNPEFIADEQTWSLISNRISIGTIPMILRIDETSRIIWAILSERT